MRRIQRPKALIPFLLAVLLALALGCGGKRLREAPPEQPGTVAQEDPDVKKTDTREPYVFDVPAPGQEGGEETAGGN